MLELVIGAYNLMTGLMSAYVLITDLEGVMASLAESGIEYSAGILGVSVAITSIGGLLMVLAGVAGMIFGALPGNRSFRFTADMVFWLLWSFPISYRWLFWEAVSDCPCCSPL